ncbi:ABC transporter substrate-binding protein [Chimaeribacter californicus]|uniref:ABC transporter substrate-binding protein n=1 Tax=Chimaeribacter californicus TaxID=2060067 RepID=A0A2N5E116_9GAMM|nr:ABC transporter substrate-binding protein [Chimaeribacter californicus]PLR34016.1 ABC transporter substrate-binding protein [Chimaeribacter californicus]
MKKNRIGLVAALLTAGLASNAPAQTLVFCSEGAPESFNPQLTTSGTTVDATSVTIYNRLVDFKVGGTTLEPSLAERWDISPDGKVYTFHLRKDVKFQTTKNFTPTRNFNADDVIFSFMRQKDPANPYHNVSGGVYANFDSMALGTLITAIDKPDDYTVRFTLAHAEAPFLADLGMYFASILSKEYADQMLKAGTPEKVDTQPVGTGPFQLVQYQKDSRILYKAFDHYWEGKPKLDRLVFTITPDAAVRYAKLEKNECQVMPFPNPADLPRMRKNPDLTLMEKPGLNIGFLAFNVKKPPLDNLKVRQALALAVNKPAIMEAVFNGTGQPAKNLLPPGVWSANTAVQDYPYDPAQAKKLLAEAGLGQGFAIDLWAMPVQRPYNPNARRMAEMIQADWAKIGVKATIVTYEWGEYLQRVKRGEHQTALMGWTTANADPDNFFGPLYSCASANGGSNSSQWCYPPFDKLITAARATTDQNQRIAMYQQAQVMMHEQVPALMIAHSTIFEPVRKEVVNYQIDPFGKHIFRYVSLKE